MKKIILLMVILLLSGRGFGQKKEVSEEDLTRKRHRMSAQSFLIKAISNSCRLRVIGGII